MKLITDIIVMKILSHLNFIDSIIIDDMNTENESEEAARWNNEGT
jgi:hypothetical protein